MDNCTYKTVGSFSDIQVTVPPIDKIIASPEVKITNEIHLGKELKDFFPIEINVPPASPVPFNIVMSPTEVQMKFAKLEFEPFVLDIPQLADMKIPGVNKWLLLLGIIGIYALATIQAIDLYLRSYP